MAKPAQKNDARPARAVRHSFTLTDNETGESWEFPTMHGTMGPKVIDTRKLYSQPAFSLMTPALRLLHLVVRRLPISMATLAYCCIVAMQSMTWRKTRTIWMCVTCCCTGNCHHQKKNQNSI